MVELRMLAVAINQRRMAYVFLIGAELKDWRTMTKPTKSQAEAAGALQDLINTFRPDVVVTEKVDETTKRSDLVQSLKQTLTRTAAQNFVLDVSVERKQKHANKYDEAASLADLYPEVKPWMPPKRKFFDHEPARLLIFEALALAHTVLQRPSERLAAAMK